MPKCPKRARELADELGVVHQLVCGSHARQALTRSELASLVAEARAGHEAAGVTGLFVYHDENFLQVLEGEDEAAVRAACDRARRDSRQAGVMVLHRGTAPERQFRDWTVLYGARELRAFDLKTLRSPKVRALVEAFQRVCNLTPASY